MNEFNELSSDVKDIVRDVIDAVALGDGPTVRRIEPDGEAMAYSMADRREIVWHVFSGKASLRGTIRTREWLDAVTHVRDGLLTQDEADKKFFDSRGY